MEVGQTWVVVGIGVGVEIAGTISTVKLNRFLAVLKNCATITGTSRSNTIVSLFAYGELNSSVLRSPRLTVG